MTASLPRHPVLRPGLRVLRRGPGEVQIGLDPRRAVVLADSEPLRRTLASVAVAGPAAAADPDVLAHLAALGLLEEHQPSVGRALPGVEVRTFGTRPLPEARDLLTSAGVTVLEPLRSPDPVGAGLLLGVGEPTRDLVDDWVREGVPHLVLRFTEGEAVVGPFVEPGHTACLRCLDAHHTDLDARWPLLVAQQAAHAERPRADGVPEPVDPVLLTLATAWAVRDLLSHLRGERPATWSSTLRLPVDLVDAESVSWLRHPQCGCTWNQVPDLRATGPDWGA